MLPDPLHPAVVHFPVVLAVLLPISALVALAAIRRDAHKVRTWVIPVVFALALGGSGWLALETGEDQEDRVEEVVAEEPIHEHEEAAERFLLLVGVTTVVLAGGLLAGTVGAAARIVGTLGTMAVLAAGVQVGHLGAELVYVHGAASAYVGRDGAGAARRGEATEPAQVALPGLFTIMAGLERDMAGASRSLWRGDLAGLATHARSVANHPRIPAAEAARIAEVLGPDAPRFVEHDTRVHDLAVRLAERSAGGDVQAVLEVEAALRAGCVACHEEFRDRLRAGPTPLRPAEEAHPRELAPVSIPKRGAR